MAYVTDLDELPQDKPVHWYTAEIERTQRMLERHKDWITYCRDKLELLKKYKHEQKKKLGGI